MYDCCASAWPLPNQTPPPPVDLHPTGLLPGGTIWVKSSVFSIKDRCRLEAVECELIGQRSACENKQQAYRILVLSYINAIPP